LISAGLLDYPSEQTGNPRAFSHFMTALLYGTPINALTYDFFRFVSGTRPKSTIPHARIAVSPGVNSDATSR
jgi:hypothetical protein